MSESRREFNVLRQSFKAELPNHCQNCESAEDLTVHHIVPLALGGRNIVTNMAILCGVCHGKVHGINVKESHGKAVITGRRKAAKPGRWSTGRIPYGFDLDRDSSLIINEAEAIVLRLIYKWRFKDRLTLTQIILILSEMAIPTKHGGDWRASSLRGILTNPLYFGDYYVSGEFIGKLNEQILDEEYRTIVSAQRDVRIYATKTIEVA